MAYPSSLFQARRHRTALVGIGCIAVSTLSIILGCGSNSPAPDITGNANGGTDSTANKGSGGASASDTRSGKSEAGGATNTSKPSSGGSSSTTASSATGVGGSSTQGSSNVGGSVSSNKSSAGGSTQSSSSSKVAPPASGGASAKGGAPGAAGGPAKGGEPAAGGSSSSGGAGGGGPVGPGGRNGRAGAPNNGGGTPNSTATSNPSTAGSGNPPGGEGKSAGCGKTPTITETNKGTPISITAAGMQRRFIVNVPTNYDNTHPYKLVVVFHHRDGNDKLMHKWQYYGLLPLSKDSTIFVAPNGQLNGAPCSGTGEGESSCGWPNSNDSDLALADAVVAKIEESFCIDTNRIFASGWSYGGSMSYRTACSRPLGGGGSATWGVRAIAIYSAAQLSGNCTPSKPVAFYASHGTSDSVLNYDNMGLPLAQNFAKANSCTWATPTKASGSHVCTNLAGCAAGYPLEFCSFKGDHTPYPDTGDSNGSWGPQEAWKFLSQF